MITIHFPINLSQEDIVLIEMLQKQQSCVIRSSYNQSHLSEKELRELFSTFTNLPNLDSWFMNSGIRCGLGKKAADDALEVSNPIFGGKRNFFKRIEGELTREELRKERLFPLHILGEAPQTGNRKFHFYFSEGYVEFRPKKGTVVRIELPKLKKKIKQKLLLLERACDEKKQPVTVQLTSTKIYFTFDDTRLFKEDYSSVNGRVLGIDLNPNYIGCSIQDKDRVIFTQLFNLTQLTGKSGEASSSPKSKRKNNKLTHEITEIAKHVVEFAKAHHVAIIGVEKLSFKQEDKGLGKSFNRLTNNVWKKCLFVRLIKKHASYLGIQVKEINAAYSSTIGNIRHSTYPDPIAASIEVGRRALPRAPFYTALVPITDLLNRWKEAAGWCYTNWQELHKEIKNSKVRYRVPIPKDGFQRFMSESSLVTTWSG